MPDLEAHALTLGALAAKGAAKLWLADSALAAKVSREPVDALSERLDGELQRARLKIFFDGLAVAVASRLEPFLQRQLEGFDRQEEVLNSVAETLERPRFDDLDLFDFALNPSYVHSYLRRIVPDAPEDLSERGAAHYDLVLRECCGCLIQVRTCLTACRPDAPGELVGLEHEVLVEVRKRLAEMRDPRSSNDFESEYLDQVRRVLDHIIFFGIRTSPTNRNYPLSVAYLSLFMDEDQSASVRAEELLGRATRLVIRGEAGSGKTTLLQWIAVQCASRRAPASLRDWTRTVPFFVPLRHYSRGRLPSPDQFVEAVGQHLAERMPAGWVEGVLSSGQAAILIDGVDELPPGQRIEVQAWLQDLVDRYPRCRFIITSRPAAIETDWLQGVQFATAELQPMTSADIWVFIERWYDAMRGNGLPRQEHEALDNHEAWLKASISRNRGLRRMAESPLLCALLCALQRDRGELPTNRMSLYEEALGMLIERRDAERQIPPPRALHQPEQRILLQDLAYWMICNGWGDIEYDFALDRLGATLGTLVGVSVPADRVLRFLLERTGLLREPRVGRIDFVHRTFQEYLAAKEAIGKGDLGVLHEHALEPEWREVIVMASGHAGRPQRDRLIAALIEPMPDAPETTIHRALLAVACLETAPDLDPALLDKVRARMRDLIPPKDYEMARAISSGQELTVDLLAQAPRPTELTEVRATIRALGLIGSDAALRDLVGYASIGDGDVRAELLKTWQAKPTAQYAEQILSRVTSSRRLEVCQEGEPVALSLPAEVLSSLHLLRGVTDLAIVEVDRAAGTIDLRNLSGSLGLRSLTIETACEGLGSLTDLPHLRSLDLLCGSSQVLEELPELARLESLSLGRAHLDERTCPLIANQVGSLNRLYLVACTGLATLVVSEPHYWHGLREVLLDRVDPDHLGLFCASAPTQLRKLTVARCGSMPAEAIASLQLAELYLSSCSKVDLAPFRYTNTNVVVGPDQEVTGAGNVPVRTEQRSWPLLRATSSRST